MSHSPPAPTKQVATKGEIELGQRSVTAWNDYVSKFMPAEAELARRAEFTAGEKARVTGEANADTANAFKGLTRSTVTSAAQGGADVSSGKTKFSLAADATAQGKASGLSQAAASVGGQLDSEQQKLGLVGLGRNIASSATANLSRGAQRATSLALAESAAKYQRNLEISQARSDLVFGVAGAAANKGLQAYKNKKFTDKLPTSKLNLPDISAPFLTETQSAFSGGFDPFQSLSFSE